MFHVNMGKYFTHSTNYAPGSAVDVSRETSITVLAQENQDRFRFATTIKAIPAGAPELLPRRTH
jgi:hypothetical protein